MAGLIEAFRKSPMARTGGMLLVLLMAAGPAAPWLAPHDPLQIDFSQRLRPPGPHFPLGTDQLGRCVFSRILFGARISLFASMAASFLALAFGLPAGLIAGSAPSRLQTPLKAFLDMALAFPGFLLVLVAAGVLGPSLTSLVIGIAGVMWPWWARLVRDLTLGAKEKEFVLGGRVSGVRGPRLMRRYILPQIAPPILVAVSLKTAWIILAMAGLGYLGLGVQPPSPEWGAMLQESRMYMVQAPWLMLAPGTAITLSMLAFNLLAEGLRDAMQVKRAWIW
ncbi:MAG: ABC transporter permease subunit [Desulfacinum sp.]|nr:ABC transporter permease subunit [Desulfacinum sp.]MBZ4658556.1 binding-protein-dependent transport system inner rane component [Desulfacinum sp.]